MRPRKVTLPQAGTGGYGIRPYVFCGGGATLAEAVLRVEFSPFVENEIRRGLMLVVISVAPEVGFIVPEVASAAKAETAQAVQRAKARAKEVSFFMVGSSAMFW